MGIAVGSERVSKITGYAITKGNFSNTTPNLPQRIAILAEANEANQATLDLTPTQLTTAKAAGDKYGYGSPIYAIMRILQPVNGGGIGGIPVWVYPQAKAAGAIQKIYEIIPAGTPTGNGTHTVVINGRRSIDGAGYDINITTSDTVATIVTKIKNAVNAAIGCPLSAADYAYEVDLTSKWSGLTSNGITVSVDTNGNTLGMTYAVNSVQTGSGTPSVQAALDLFGSDWNTVVINSYGLVSSTLSLLEAFNGIPDPVNPTGRYSGIIMKPFIALSGSVADNDSATTDLRLNDVTIAVCPAPLSKALPMEAAANAALLFARQAQDSPHLDISGQAYPDMPVPVTLNIGTMMSYDYRDQYVKKGNSTVDIISGSYVIQDFVTTYHPTGELPPQFRYCRSLVIDLNIRFAYYLLEQLYVVDHAIAADDDIVSATNVVKPKNWKATIQAMADDLANRALIANAGFMQDSIKVDLSTTNPDRLQTFFRYKRSGYTRILETIAQAGFNFGTN